jgi:hypothetical protein
MRILTKASATYSTSQEGKHGYYLREVSNVFPRSVVQKKNHERTKRTIDERAMPPFLQRRDAPMLLVTLVLLHALPYVFLIFM